MTNVSQRHEIEMRVGRIASDTTQLVDDKVYVWHRVSDEEAAEIEELDGVRYVRNDATTPMYGRCTVVYCE